MSTPSNIARGDSNVDRQRFRDVLAAFASGVTIVTSADADGTPRGTTVSAFASISVDPSLVVVSLAKESLTATAITQRRAFAVHILDSNHVDTARHFAMGAPDKFSAIAYTTHATGVPRLDSCPAHLVCTLAAEYPGGDHVLLLGEVIEAHDGTGAPPMVYHQRTFRSLGDPLPGQGVCHG